MGKRNQHFTIDTLEPRRLLSGNVSVSYDGTTLLVVGDNAANEILITDSAAGYLVNGLSSTHVNGGASFAVDTGGNFADITVRTGNGDDLVQLGVAPPAAPTLTGQAIRVDTGNGNDTVDLAATIANVSLSVTTGNGNDTVQSPFYRVGPLDFFTLIGDFSIDTGNGDDLVQLPATTDLDFFSYVAGNLIINTGNGNDAIATEGAEVGGAIQIDSGNGADSLSLINSYFDGMALTTGSGDDTLLIVGGFNVAISFDSDALNSGAFDVLIDTGDGNDVVDTHAISFGGFFGENLPLTTFRLGNGNDTLRIDAGESASQSTIIFNALIVDAGNGNDTIEANNLLMQGGGIEIDGGNGNNAVRMAGINSQYAPLTIRGGNGSDLVSVDGDPQISFLSTSRLSRIRINTGGGSDRIELANTALGESILPVIPGTLDSFIDTGDGDDLVTLGSLRLYFAFNLMTGRGNDSVAITAPVVMEKDPFFGVGGGPTLLDGGSGRDILTGLSFYDPAAWPLTVTAFETVVA
jgi:hypothetical protein